MVRIERGMKMGKLRKKVLITKEKNTAKPFNTQTACELAVMSWITVRAWIYGSIPLVYWPRSVNSLMENGMAMSAGGVVTTKPSMKKAIFGTGASMAYSGSGTRSKS